MKRYKYALIIIALVLMSTIVFAVKDVIATEQKAKSPGKQLRIDQGAIVNKDFIIEEQVPTNITTNQDKALIENLFNVTALSPLTIDIHDLYCKNQTNETKYCQFKVYKENLTDTTLVFTVLNNATLQDILSTRDSLVTEHTQKVEQYLLDKTKEKQKTIELVDELYLVKVE